MIQIERHPSEVACVFPPEPWQGHCLLQSDFNDQSSAVWINTLLGFHTTWIPHCLDSTLIRFHTAWIPLCSTAMCLLGAKKPAMFLRAPEMQLPVASCFFNYNQITICSTETTRGGMHWLKPSWIDQDWGSSSKNGCYSGIWCTMFGWCHSLLCRPRLLNVKHSIGETFGKLILERGVVVCSLVPVSFHFQSLSSPADLKPMVKLVWSK